MPLKFSNMNRIFILIFCILSVIKANAQIYSSSVQGIDCSTPYGYVVLDSTSTILLIEWQFKGNNNWTTIDSFPSITVNSLGDSLSTTECGLYKVKFYYNNGLNQYIDSFAVSCPITIGQGQEPILCYGDSSGIIKRPVYGGVKFDPDTSVLLLDTFSGDEYYVYEWYFADDSTGLNTILLSDTNENLIGASAGWYKTIVTDAVGCSDSIDFTEFKNPQKFRVDTSFVEKNNCRGDTIASIFLKVIGGKKIMQTHKYLYYLTLNNDTISFSDSDSTSSNFTHFSSSDSMSMLAFYPDTIKISNLAAGSYIFSAIDSNDCTMIYTINVEEPDAYEPYTTPASSICASDSVEFIIDSIIGGNQNITYNFLINGNDTIYVLPGDYDIIVKDSLFSCLDTISVSIDAQYEIKISDSIQHISCYGDSTGIITIDSINGGNSPYSVQWGGAFPNDSLSISLLSAGTYTAFIVDSSGCTLIQDFIVEQPSAFSANAIFYPPSCNGFSDGNIKIEPNGGVKPYIYNWLNGTGTVDSLYGLTSGIYSVVISDSLSCVDTISLTLNEPEQIAFSFTNYDSTLLCNGEFTLVDVLISGGTGPFDILWNDGNTDAQRVISAGTYTCLITDTNGCLQSDAIEISEPNPFGVQPVDYNNPTCDSGGDANVETVGGTLPISYLWSTGDTTNNLDSLFEGDYWVIASDSCGNSDTVYFTLTPFELVTELIYDITTYIGLIEINSSSTGGPFSYEWIDINGIVISSDSMTSNLCEGAYFVTTNDGSTNCSITDTLIATYYLPNGIVDVTTTTVFSDSNLWGNPPYSYFWDNAEISAHANICSGSHWVEVTDADGCVVRSDFDIDPLLIALDPAEFIIECNIENLDVDITADVTGGTAPYTYAWSNGSTGNLINLSLNPGNYTVTVMDNNACTEDTSFVIAAISADCVPNVFTPNGDNINDTWSLENTFLYSDSEIRIYGRYGKLLFQSVGYNIPWDGRNENGNDVPEGSYFYHIEIGHDFDVIKGSVAILR